MQAKIRSALYGFYARYGIVGRRELMLFFAALSAAQRQALAALIASVSFIREEIPFITAFGRQSNKIYRWHRLCSYSCRCARSFQFQRDPPPYLMFKSILPGA